MSIVTPSPLLTAGKKAEAVAPFSIDNLTPMWTLFVESSAVNPAVTFAEVAVNEDGTQLLFVGPDADGSDNPRWYIVTLPDPESLAGKVVTNFDYTRNGGIKTTTNLAGGFQWGFDGKYLFSMNSGEQFYRFTMGTNYNITTQTSVAEIGDPGNIDDSVRGFFCWASGAVPRYFYTGSQTDRIHEINWSTYPTGTPADSSAGSVLANTLIPNSFGINDIYLTPDGTKIFGIGFNNTQVAYGLTMGLLNTNARIVGGISLQYQSYDKPGQTINSLLTAAGMPTTDRFLQKVTFSTNGHYCYITALVGGLVYTACFKCSP